ncbi:alpha/beta hydrolase [uncultured Maribacter sp.]|uniref:alpha/beta hydrolase n=1 Tax=uncultured Maribacter sp. TaxID=431308 RepID=UPI0030DD8A60|tara:strand:+ start:728 stop:2131 length:1404 start_codon:yes stop_codon:yes gene_type:complete
MNTRLCTIFFLLVALFACTNTSSDEVLNGVLEVPENRNNPSSRTLKLVYKVLKAKKNDSTKTPVVFLQGGPGVATLITEEFWANHPLRNDRDIVLMDQRGTGESQANCSHMGEELFKVMGQDYNIEEDYEATKIILAKCKKSIQKKGVDLEGYNSRENATDFEDLRKALGIKKWNLYGVSYGSRLGLTIMRDFPENVRSAILLGVHPPESNLFGDRVRSIDKSLLAILKSCKENKGCNSRYPNLKERLHKVLAKMQTEPLQVKYKGKPFVLNYHDTFVLLSVSLYDRHSIGNIPFFIEALENGDTKPIIEFLKAFETFYNYFNLPMNFSVVAYEELPFYDDEDLDMAIKQSEFGFNYESYDSTIKLTTDWHSYRAENIENQPVASNIPTILMSGNFDPVTPPNNANEALKYLKNGYAVTFQDESHNLLNPCVLKITEDFINDPMKKPNLDCNLKRKFIEWNLSKSNK